MLADRLKAETAMDMGKEILLIIVNLMFSDLEILYARVQKLEWSHI